MKMAAADPIPTTSVNKKTQTASLDPNDSFANATPFVGLVGLSGFSGNPKSCTRTNFGSLAHM
jgi:hypothetical protein